MQFNGLWLEQGNIESILTKSWDRPTMSGWMDFYLKEKIKALKGDFK